MIALSWPFCGPEAFDIAIEQRLRAVKIRLCIRDTPIRYYFSLRQNSLLTIQIFKKKPSCQKVDDLGHFWA